MERWLALSLVFAALSQPLPTRADEPHLLWQTEPAAPALAWEPAPENARPWYARGGWDHRDPSWDLGPRVRPAPSDATAPAEDEALPTIDVTLETRAGYASANGERGEHIRGAYLNRATLARLDLDAQPVQPEGDGMAIGVHARLEHGDGALVRSSLTPDADFHVVRLFAELEPSRSTAIRVGTLDGTEGALPLFDTHVARILNPAVGVAVHHDAGIVDVTVGVGDAGLFLRRAGYSFVADVGGTVRIRPSEGLSIAFGADALIEPQARESSWAEERVEYYEDYSDERVVAAMMASQGAGLLDDPELLSETSRMRTALRGIAALRYETADETMRVDVQISARQRPTGDAYAETIEDRTVTLYLPELSDDRFEIGVGSEMSVQTTDWLRVRLGALVFRRSDADDPTPSDGNSLSYGAVARAEATIAEESVEWLFEASGFGEDLREPTPGFDEGQSADRRVVQLKSGPSVHLPLGELGALDARIGAGIELEQNAAGNATRFLLGGEAAINFHD